MKTRIVGLAMAFCFASVLHAKSLDETIAFCDECHGKGGVSKESDVPTIAGFSSVAITDILNAYKNDSRSAVSSKFRAGDTSRPETSMKDITKKLTADEIKKLAAHFSAQTFVPAKQPFDAAKAASGAKIHKTQCFKCHENGGSSKDDDVGILAGQWSPYLRTAIQNFRSGKRQTDQKMFDLVKKLSESEIDALVHYWASQQ